jgi:hypothetical protein
MSAVDKKVNTSGWPTRTRQVLKLSKINSMSAEGLNVKTSGLSTKLEISKNIEINKLTKTKHKYTNLTI